MSYTDYTAIAWHVAEMKAMLEAVNDIRRQLGYSPVSLREIIRADSYASGHYDYSAKFALYCAELAKKPEGT